MSSVTSSTIRSLEGWGVQFLGMISTPLLYYYLTSLPNFDLLGFSGLTEFAK